MFSDCAYEDKQLQLICLIIYFITSCVLYNQQLVAQFITLHSYQKIKNIIKFYNNFKPYKTIFSLVGFNSSLFQSFSNIFVSDEYAKKIYTAIMLKKRDNFALTMLSFRNPTLDLSDNFKNNAITFLNNLLNEIDNMCSSRSEYINMVKKLLEKINSIQTKEEFINLFIN